MECINCGHEHITAYCPVCGENSGTERITFGSILNSLVAYFTNVDKGVLSNIKQLTVAPKKIILQYVAGRRKGIYNPLSYAILMTSVFLILDAMINLAPLSIPSGPFNEDLTYNVGIEIGQFLKGKIKFFWLLNIVFLSLFTKLIFKRFNFFEHLSINAFIIGHATLIAILSIPIKLPIVLNPLVIINMIVLLYFVYKNEDNPWETFFMSSFSVFFASSMLFLIPLLIVLLTSL